MAGRWKVGANGQPEWEELADGVSAPDQIAPPGSSTSTTPPPWPDDPGGWGKPGGPIPGRRPGPISPRVSEDYPFPPPTYPPAPPTPPPATPPTSPDTVSDMGIGTVGLWAGPKGPRLNPGDPGYGLPPEIPANPGDVSAVGTWAGPKGPRLNPGDPGYGDTVPPEPPPTTPPPPKPPAETDSKDWDESRFTSTFGRPSTPQELLALEARLSEVGIRVLRNAAGVAGKIQLPNGEIIDVINAAGAGGRGFQWLTGDGGSGGGGSSSRTSSAVGSELLDILMRRANQSLDVNERDPIIARQVNAYSGQQQRAAGDYLSRVAERGGPNANLAGESRMVSERVGLATGAFEASTVQRELDARRQEIQAALSGALGYVSDQDRLALTRELEDLARQQRRYEFDKSLGQRAYEFDIDDEYRRSPLAS